MTEKGKVETRILTTERLETIFASRVFPKQDNILEEFISMCNVKPTATKVQPPPFDPVLMSMILTPRLTFPTPISLPFLPPFPYGFSSLMPPLPQPVPVPVPISQAPTPPRVLNDIRQIPIQSARRAPILAPKPYKLVCCTLPCPITTHHHHLSYFQNQRICSTGSYPVPGVRYPYELPKRKKHQSSCKKRGCIHYKQMNVPVGPLIPMPRGSPLLHVVSQETKKL